MAVQAGGWPVYLYPAHLPGAGTGLPHPPGHWARVAGLGLVSLFTLLAHTLIEPPQQIYGTWANNLSTPAPLYSVDPKHLHNLFDVESPLLGVLATVLSIVLTALLLLAWAVAIRDARRPADALSRHA